MNIKQLLFTMSMATSICSSSTTVADQTPSNKDYCIIIIAGVVWVASKFFEAKIKKPVSNTHVGALINKNK
jgi:hypothetical protein